MNFRISCTSISTNFAASFPYLLAIVFASLSLCASATFNQLWSLLVVDIMGSFRFLFLFFLLIMVIIMAQRVFLCQSLPPGAAPSVVKGARRAA
ncbi:hypothetical protein [Microviridae sp.]|nr:hypothetical protein [Microviridae sp.]